MLLLLGLLNPASRRVWREHVGTCWHMWSMSGAVFEDLLHLGCSQKHLGEKTTPSHRCHATTNPLCFCCVTQRLSSVCLQESKSWRVNGEMLCIDTLLGGTFSLIQLSTSSRNAAYVCCVLKWHFLASQDYNLLWYSSLVLSCCPRKEHTAHTETHTGCCCPDVALLCMS